jgi:hypothetical protein
MASVSRKSSCVNPGSRKVRHSDSPIVQLLPHYDPCDQRVAGVLSIGGGGLGLPVYYYVRPVPVDFGEAGFEVAKFVTQQRGDGDEVYQVLLDGLLKSSCTCMGFERHGHCKHLDSVRELYAAGKLKAAPKVPRWRSLADMAANDPQAYAELMEGFPERCWPPVDEDAEAEFRYAGREEECSCPLCGEPSDQGVHDSCAAEEQARADQE